MAKESNRVPTTGEERWQHLQEQMGFIRRSCREFDQGNHAEAKCMANDVVKLVFNERGFRSVLHQVKLMPGMGFLSTVSKNALPFGAMLVATKFGPEGASYEAFAANPKFAEFSPPRLMQFADWWNEPVIYLAGGKSIPRWKIARNLRDQQGGGHVDPEIDAEMADLKRNNPVGQTWAINGQDMGRIPGVELHTMRQIAHEVLISIERKLRKGPG